MVKRAKIHWDKSLEPYRNDIYEHGGFLPNHPADADAENKPQEVSAKNSNTNPDSATPDKNGRGKAA